MSIGDPKADLAYERQYEHQQTYHVIPEVIKNFLQYFHKTISDLIDQKVYELQANRVSSESIEQKIYEIQDVYENRLVDINWRVLSVESYERHWCLKVSAHSNVIILNSYVCNLTIPDCSKV